jgi:SSS family solute:Na+ symporter
MFNLNSTIILGIAAAYILVTSGISIWSNKFAGTTSTFMTGGRNIGVFVISFLLVSEWISTGSTVGTAELAYNKGLSVVWNVLSLTIALFLFSIFMAKKYQKTGEYTISGLISKRYGQHAALLASVITIYAFAVVIVMLYVGGAATLSAILNIPMNIAIWLTAFIAIVYVVAGGMKSVAYTNVVHALFKIAGVTITAVVALNMSGGFWHLHDVMPPKYFSFIEGVGIAQIIAWIVGSIGAVFCTQYVIQAIGSMAGSKQAMQASAIAGFIIIPVAFMSSLIGIAAKYVFPDIKAVWAIPIFASHMNPVLGGIVVSSLMAAVFGAASAMTLGSTALIMRDIYVPLVKPSDRHSLIAARLIAVLFGLVPVFFALLAPEIIKTLFFSRALRTSLSVVVICMFYLPFFSSGRGVTIGLVLSVIITTVWYILQNPFGVDNIYIAIVVPSVVMAIDHVVTRMRKEREIVFNR